MAKKSESRKEAKETLKLKYNSIIEGHNYTQQVVSLSMKNVLFDTCHFSSVTFKSTSFENVIFHNCQFFRCKFIEITQKYQEYFVFEKSTFTLCDFKDIRFIKILVFDCIFSHVKFTNTNIYGSSFAYTAFMNVIFKENSNIENINIIRPMGWLDIQFDNNQGVIKVNRNTHISKFDYKNNVYGGTKEFPVFEDSIISTSSPTWSTYKSDAVGETLLNLAHQFKLHNMNNLYGKYFFDGKIQIHKKLPPWRKFKSFIGLITCGYGEKWYLGLFTSLATILMTAIIYMFNGIIVGATKVVNYDFSFTKTGFKFTMEKLYDFGYSLYYSIMTFTTVGYGNIQAYSEITHIFSSLQMYFGVILMAVITGSILRKLFR